MARKVVYAVEFGRVYATGPQSAHTGFATSGYRTDPGEAFGLAASMVSDARKRGDWLPSDMLLRNRESGRIVGGLFAHV